MRLFPTRLSSRIYSLLAIGWTVAAAFALFIGWRFVSTRTAYENLLRTEVNRHDAARRMQLTFKKQVQEWKTILLRGADVESLKKHESAFLKESAGVRSIALELKRLDLDQSAAKMTDEFIAAHEALVDRYATALSAFKESCGAAVEAADKTVQGMDRLPTDLIDRLVDQLKARTTVAADRRAAAAQDELLIAGILIAIAFALAAGSTVLTSQRITRSLERAVNTLSDASGEIATASQSVAAWGESFSSSSSQQSNAIESSSQSTEEIATVAQQTSSIAGQLLSIMRESERSGEQVDVALKQMSGSIAEIGSSSQKISSIIKLIDDIAFHTNIVALNASIEAARAGSAGLGFAVVAEEVRELALRSSTAAKDISELIHESARLSRQGKERLDEVASASRASAEFCSKAVAIAKDLNAGSTQQATSIGRINVAISSLGEAARRATEGAHNTASAGVQLKAQAEKITATTGDLRAIVIGTRS